MPEIRPIKDLKNTTEISELCHQLKEPLFITKNGWGYGCHEHGSLREFYS